MSDVVDRIATIQATRTTTAKVLADSLANVSGKSEVEVCHTALENLSAHTELYPSGWYDPPPGGVSMLWGQSPFTRLQYESLRDEQNWPSGEIRYDAETIGFVYISSVNRTTNMIGDVGLTIYAGMDEATRRHIRKCHDAVFAVADQANVGERLSDLYDYAMNYFQQHGLKVGWMTTVHDPLHINLGHTVPGSYGERLTFGSIFEEIRETIRTRRIYINRAEQFSIPETCALTVEARLVDVDEKLPNTFFHFIVTFAEGEKKICVDFDDIFRNMRMDYML